MSLQTKSSTAQSIAFIGGGNMAQALISGLLAKGYLPQNLHVADPSHEKLQEFASLGVNTYDANDSNNTAQAIEKADIVVLAVKPQVIEAVLSPLMSAWGNQLVISILAGTATHTLKTLLGKDTRLVPPPVLSFKDW